VTFRDDSGWWKGKLEGVEGVFPGNYVTLLPYHEIAYDAG
jgi:hypothetical protein